MSVSVGGPPTPERLDLVVAMLSGETTRWWRLQRERSRLLRFDLCRISFSICRSRLCSRQCRCMSVGWDSLPLLHLVYQPSVWRFVAFAVWSGLDGFPLFLRLGVSPWNWFSCTLSGGFSF
ncbi:hypothetical protein Bca101_024524 [Brassica carinata]